MRAGAPPGLVLQRRTKAALAVDAALQHPARAGCRLSVPPGESRLSVLCGRRRLSIPSSERRLSIPFG